MFVSLKNQILFIFAVITMVLGPMYLAIVKIMNLFYQWDQISCRYNHCQVRVNSLVIFSTMYYIWGWTPDLSVYKLHREMLCPLFIWLIQVVLNSTDKWKCQVYNRFMFHEFVVLTKAYFSNYTYIWVNFFVRFLQNFDIEQPLKYPLFFLPPLKWALETFGNTNGS